MDVKLVFRTSVIHTYCEIRLKINFYVLITAVEGLPTELQQNTNTILTKIYKQAFCSILYQKLTIYKK